MQALKLTDGSLQSKGRHLITYPDDAVLDGSTVTTGPHAIEVPDGSTFVDAAPAIAAGFAPRPIVAMVPVVDGGDVVARTQSSIAPAAAKAEILDTHVNDLTVSEWQALADDAGLDYPDKTKAAAVADLKNQARA